MTQSIQQLATSWAAAVASQDLTRIMTFYADELVAYDAVAQLQFTGKAAYQAHWQKCLEFCSGGHSKFELRDLKIQQNDAIGFSHALVYCEGSNEKGETQGCWMRLTQGWQKQQDNWRIFHDHFSVPFDMVSGAVLFELTPDL
ncbi:nuclear transport factor 2 family protein [Rheinheimera sp.]|jgi:ketosteroid isomerase-like protein|uniref:YybH family protein n=1 Tax=Rheinheimera sp. TaxID=1869214 RepID=UPI00261C6728|nr:nuclear transport factor 2 family protein [Rheinheimera sp.]MCA1929030.1 nuclear transport factor 2 family protein [Rheinheimera sp.]